MNLILARKIVGTHDNGANMVEQYKGVQFWIISENQKNLSCTCTALA